MVKELAHDYTRAQDLSPRDRAMLDYAAKLTRTPWEMKREDVAALGAAGFLEESVLEINQVAAYFAYVNRIADGLGVELEK